MQKKTGGGGFGGGFYGIFANYQKAKKMKKARKPLIYKAFSWSC